MSSITFTSDLNNSKLDAGIREANKKIEQWVQGVENSTTGLDKSMQKVGGLIATYFSVRQLVQFGKQVVEMRGQFQQLGIAFETMLGSKEKADKLMQEAIAFSQKTPFTLIDVTSNIKQLMAMGIATEDVMETMKNLGDVAAGVSVPISRIAINYGQVATLGKLQGRELRDFAMAGVPLIDQLAKNLGKTKNEIQEMVTAGKIGFPMVEAAFKSMASEGGKFYNLMEKQNKSVTGQISNLSDKWQVMLNEIGKSNEGLIYSGIGGLNYLITNYKSVIEVLKGLILVLGAAKVASMYVAYEQKIQAAVSLLVAGATDKQTIADARWIVMQERKTAAQKALNKSMLTNPYVLAAAAIAAMGFAIYKLITYETDLQKALKKTDIEIENEKDKALDLFSSLKAAKEGTEAWSKARQAIINQYGDLLPSELKELKNLNDIAEAQELVNKKLSDNIAIRTREATIQEISVKYNPKIIDAQKDIIKEVESKIGEERAATVKYEIAKLVAEYKAGLPGAEQALIDYRRKLMAEVGKVNAEGLATSISAANMANAFNPLIEALKNVKKETDLTNEAFEKLGNTIVFEIPKGTPIIKGKTAAEQRIELRKQLIIEEKKLRELETTPSADPLKAIKEQEEVIKTLKEQLGITNKAIKEGEKTKKEHLEYETEIGRQLISNQLDIEQKKLDLQKDSAEKQRAQAELDFRRRLVDIKNRQADELKAYNEQIGGINIDTGEQVKGKYTSKLPEKQQAQIDELIILNEQKKANDIVLINEKAAEEQKAIYDEIIAYRLKGIDKEKAAVKKKYDDMTKEVKALNEPEAPALLSEIEKQRAAANLEIENKYAIEKLDIEEKIELSKNEILVKGFNREEKLRDLNFKTFKKYEEQKIAILKAEGTPESIKQVEILQAALQTSSNKTEEESLKRQLELRNEIVQSVARLVNQIGQQLGLDERAMSLLNAGLDTFTQLASGDLVGAATSFLSGIIAQIPSAASKFEAQIERINNLLEEQQRLIELSARTGGEQSIREQNLKTLEQKEAAARAEYERLQEKADTHLDLLGWRQKKADAAKEAWEAVTIEVENATQALNDFMSGGVTQNTIADTIAQAFEEGKTSIDDFADYMNDVLLDAVMSIFKNEILGESINQLSEKIKESLKDKVLTAQEKQDIDAQVKLIADTNKQVWQDLTSSLNLGAKANEPKGLSGAIQRTITEDTGTELAGLMRKISDDNRQNRDYNKISVEELSQVITSLRNIESILKGQQISIINAPPIVEAPIVNTTVNTEAPIVNTKAPVVNIEAPVVNIEAPIINVETKTPEVINNNIPPAVNIPEQKTPQITINQPKTEIIQPDINLTIPPIENEINIPEFDVPEPVINNEINIPEAKPPEVNVTNVNNVEAPLVDVNNINEVKPPDVNVTNINDTNPPEVNVINKNEIEAPAIEVNNVTQVKPPDVNIEPSIINVEIPQLKQPEVNIAPTEIENKIKIPEDFTPEIINELKLANIELIDILTIQENIAKNLQAESSSKDLTNQPDIKINVPEVNILNSTILKGEPGGEAGNGTDLMLLIQKYSEENKQVRDYSREGVSHLINIEANTFNTVLELQKANLKLDTVITNTKPVYSGL